MKHKMATNVPELSVSDLAQSLRRTVEGTFARVRVRGELGRVTLHSSGHIYATLKDTGAVLDVICWRGVVAGLSLTPQEGLEVICTGRVTTYPQRSTYQLIIESMELAGAGALLALLEARKKALAAQGLFAAERKKPLPFAPRTIGVITSPTGAVIRDIIHRVEARFPCRILLWPVCVQGPSAAGEIAAAIKGFDALTGDLRPDVLIVARGGGSLEDLMPFNEEVVVRAAAACALPLISAVGHETDTTLLDYAADKRAPTPTAAAEIATPVRTELLAQVSQSVARLRMALSRFMTQKTQRVEDFAARLDRPERVLERPTQALDIASTRLSRAYSVFLHTKASALALAAGKLPHPKGALEGAQRLFMRASSALARIAPHLTERPQQRLTSAARLLSGLSFHSILERGFVLVRDGKTHKPLTRAHQIRAGQHLSLTFADKEDLPVRVESAL